MPPCCPCRGTGQVPYQPGCFHCYEWTHSGTCHEMCQKMDWTSAFPLAVQHREGNKKPHEGVDALWACPAKNLLDTDGDICLKCLCFSGNAHCVRVRKCPTIPTPEATKQLQWKCRFPVFQTICKNTGTSRLVRKSTTKNTFKFSKFRIKCAD